MNLVGPASTPIDMIQGSIFPVDSNFGRTSKPTSTNTGRILYKTEKYWTLHKTKNTKRCVSEHKTFYNIDFAIIINK